LNQHGAGVPEGVAYSRMAGKAAQAGLPTREVQARRDGLRALNDLLAASGAGTGANSSGANDSSSARGIDDAQARKAACQSRCSSSGSWCRSDESQAECSSRSAARSSVLRSSRSRNARA
jgi:hypothetical protein